MVKRSFSLVHFVLIFSLMIAGLSLTTCGDANKPREEAIVRNYSFPPGAYRGDKLSQFYKKQRSYIEQEMSQPELGRYKRLEAKRLHIVELVEIIFADTFSGLDKSRQNIFKQEIAAVLQDVDKVKEFVQYGFSYTHESGNVATLIFGLEQLEEWRNGMLSWGVLYNPGQSVWPRGFLTAPPNQISQSGRKITGGDWKGAWEIQDGRIYIPGLLFFKEVEVEILRN